MSPNEKIKVEGYVREFVYGEVADSIIKLSDKFYFKDDTERVVRVVPKSGSGYRLFRKESPLIVHVGGGKYMLRSDTIKTEDNVFISKENVVYIDGKPVRASYCTEIDNKHYLLTDPSIVKCVFSKRYCLKSKAVKLLTKHYPQEAYVSPDNVHNLVKTEDGYIKAADAVVQIKADGSIVNVHRELLQNQQLFNVFLRFKDATNPQADRLDKAFALQADAKNFVVHDGLGIHVHQSMYKDVDKIYKDVIELARREATDKIKAQINKNFSDAGPDENIAKVISMDYQTWPGKHPIIGNKNVPVISKTLKEVGGIGYTMGFEFETSAGLLTKQQAASVDLKAVGDRSIGAAEYVTGILHGDDAIKRLKDICAVLSENTLVDDRCGLHVHIGGLADTPKVAMPNYDRHFSMLAIKLGCLIEEDLYKISPPNRKPTLYHCHSIMRWKDINKDNWKPYLGAYVFGPKEDWDEPFDFDEYTYGEPGRTGNSAVGAWCGGRYKWLNLVHIATRSQIKTCEFRIFAGTTNFEKVYAYALISLAFVWLIENKPALIDKGITLDKMVIAAYQKSPTITDFLLDFFKKRRAKFDRTKIYKGKIPSPNLY